jgi:hypothetical protein
MRHAAVMALAGAGLLVSPALSETPLLTGPGTIRITSREVSDTFVDVGKRGMTPGDTQIVREQLFNTRITPKPIGHAEIVCTFTVASSRYCSGTFFLPKGKIVVAGPIYYRQLYELAVTGGTGLYDNVRGSLTATTTSEKPRREVLIFRLTV